MTTTALSARPRTLVGPSAALVGVLLAALALLALVAGPASAHAQVREYQPFDGAVLDEAPAEVSVLFNEGVQLPTAGLRVFDAEGERVDDGEAMVDPADPNRIVVALPDDLDDGTYVVTWRAVSADGHPIKGAWLWSLGEGGEVGDDLVAALFSGSGDAPLAVAAIVVQAVAIGGLLLLSGVAAFWLLVARRPGPGTATLASEEEAAGLADLARRGALAAAVALLLSVPLQAMLETGLGLGALAPAPLLDVVTAPVGWSALLGAAVALAAHRLLGGGWSPAGTAVAVAAVLTLPLAGHTRTQDPVAVMLLGDVVHVVAGATWAGGLLALGLVLRGRRRADDPVGAARLVAGFSRVATWSLLLVVAGGGAMSWVTVRAARAVTTTDYGWTLLAKLLLVAVLVVAGVYNNRRLVPAVVAGAAPAGGSEADAPDPTPEGAPARPSASRIADGAWVRLRQVLRLDAALLAGVVLATGVLVGQQPAAQEAGVTGAYSTYEDLTDDLEVNLVVDPNRVGLNEVHIYLLDRQGRTVDARDVLFVLEQPSRDLGPFERVPADAGPGHWSLVGRELAVAGDWQITVVVRLDTFTEERVTIPFTVNA